VTYKFKFARIYKPQQKEASDISNIATDEWLEERRRKRAEMFGETAAVDKPPTPRLSTPEEKSTNNYLKMKFVAI